MTCQLLLYSIEEDSEHKQKQLIACTAPQHSVCRVVQSLHINHMQMSIIEVFICRRLHMNTSMILICIWLICRLCTALHTKCCGAVLCCKANHVPDMCLIYGTDMHHIITQLFPRKCLTGLTPCCSMSDVTVNHMCDLGPTHSLDISFGRDTLFKSQC